MRRSVLLSFASTALLGALTPAQPTFEAPQASGRWIVMFTSRDFDLSRYRAAIRTRLPAAEVQEIVRDLERRARRHQAGFVTEVQRTGGRIHAQWWLINGCCIEATDQALAHLTRHPLVDRIVADRMRELHLGNATNSDNHNADWATARGYTGVGVTTAILDSGFDVAGARPHRTFFVGGDPTDQSGGGLGGSRVLHAQQIGSETIGSVAAHGTGVSSVVAGGGWGSPNSDLGHAPGAKFVLYSIADDTRGSSSDASDIAAWQQLAADRVTYNIVAANNSYGGEPVLNHPAQVALDAAAFHADVMICNSAGNGGTTSGTSRSQSTANGITVAAIEHTTHRMASFSSRGPLVGQNRFYPDIAAIGRSVYMARAGDESGDYRASGTSFSSPQVAGSATLVRSANPALSALETKAILMASAEDIGAANPGEDRNWYGVGMLRDDFALIAALRAGAGRGEVVTATVDRNNTTWSRSIPVADGHTYRVVVTWHRDPNLSPNYANLDIELRDGGGALIGASTTPNNLDEWVSFVANSTGAVRVTVTAQSFQQSATSQSFALALSKQPGAPFTGGYTSFGAGCQGQNGVPRIQNTGRPMLGASMTVALDRAAGNASAFLFTGFSNQSTGGFQLPLDLGPFGGGACWLLVSLDVMAPGTTDATGRAGWGFTFPSDETLVGARVYQQAVVLDGTANGLGVALSQGAELVLGNR